MQTLAADKKTGRAGRITLRDELAEVLGSGQFWTAQSPLICADRAEE
jgi:hypothetical protein